MTSTSLTMGVA